MSTKKYIYVIVEVTYDYHRFQRNLGFRECPNDALDYANSLGNSMNLPVKTYWANGAYHAQIDREAKDGNEQPHIWIQSMLPNVEDNV